MVFLIVLSCLAFYFLEIEMKIEHQLYDLRLGFNQDVPIHPSIVIIQSTRSDLAKYNDLLRSKKEDSKNKKAIDLPLEYYFQTIKKAINAGAKNIAYILNPAHFPYNKPEYGKLEEVINRAQGKLTIGTTLNANGLSIPRGIKTKNVFAWHGLAVYSFWDKARSVIMSWDTLKGPVRNIGSHLYEQITKRLFIHDFKQYLKPLSYFKNPEGFYIHYNPEVSFPTYSISEVLSSDFPYSNLEDKIIFIGSGFQSTRSMPDNAVLHNTPIHNKLRKNDWYSRVKIWAWTLNSMLTDNMIVIAPHWVKFATSFVLIVLCYLTIITLNLILGTFLTITFGFCLLGISILLLSQANIWLNITTPYFFMIVTFLISTFYKIMQQMEKTWNINERAKAAWEVSNLKTHFMQLISQNLDQVSQRIINYLQTLKSIKNTGSKTACDALSQTEETARDFDTYIQNIINFSSIELKKTRIPIKEVNASTCLNKVIDQYNFKLKEKNIKLSYVRHHDSPLHALGDVHIIEQIFSNILGNAVKYSPPNTKIVISEKKPHPSYIQFDFSDEGPGIPEDFKHKIFEKFYRIKDDAVYSVKGTGLGLYLVKYLLRLMRGMILVTNNTHKGCTFHILFLHKRSLGEFYYRKKVKRILANGKS